MASQPPAPQPPQVALFVTCLTDQFHPRVGVAVVKVLEQLGCRLHFPSRQTCCGQPHFNNGFMHEARELAKRMIEIFEPYEYIVTPSASCCAMVREQYPRLFAGDHAWEHGMRRLCERTFEFVEFLERILRVDPRGWKLPQPVTATYHYNCHLRPLGIPPERPARFLQQMGNVSYIPMEKADQCCGFGGTFAVKYPAISGAIVEDKARCIQATGAQVTVVNDAGCAMNIGGACHRLGVRTEVRHLAELIAQAMGLDIEGW